MEILQAIPGQLFTGKGMPYSGLYKAVEGIPFTYSAETKISERLYTVQEYTASLVRGKLKVKGGYDIPVSTMPVPTVFDYSRAFLKRYFVQKRTQPRESILEITLEQFLSIDINENPFAVNGRLYNKVEIDWYITGTETFVKFTNEKNLKAAEQAFPGIINHLRDPLQFFKPVV